MRTASTSARAGAGGASAFRLLGTLATALTLLLLAAPPATAAVHWTITSVHGPQTLAPNGTGLYVLQPFNVGTSDTTTTYTITDTLPAGVTATGFSGAGWTCPNLNATPIVCTDSDLVRPPGTTTGTDANIRGAAKSLTLDVSAGSGISGSGDNVATISGGGVAAVAGSATDTTAFGSTPAGFGFVPRSFVADAFDAAAPTGGTGGNVVRQAGSHPFEFRVGFGVNLALGSDPQLGLWTKPDEDTKTLETRLPAGLIGNPQAVPQCDPVNLDTPGPGSKGSCPSNTQVGSVDLLLQEGAGIDTVLDEPVYNMVPPSGVVAAFALSFIARPVWILITLDPTDHYSVIATVKDTTEVLVPRSVQLTLWGVPGDPAHDPLRMNPDLGGATAMNTPFTGAPIKPFLTMPSQCDVAGAVRVRADSWDHPGVFTPFQSGASALMTGCDDPRFQFALAIHVQPDAATASTPTGVGVDLSVPQKNDTVTTASDLYAQNGKDVAINTPPLRTARVTLPEGMTVSPSSADGLGACTPSQIGLGTNDEPGCPDASMIATVQLETPLLKYPLQGAMYLATPYDNPFGTLLAIYLVANGPGVVIKLPGRVDADPATGQLTATFDDNPQLPFSNLHVEFSSGPRAPLTTPDTCGTFTTQSVLTGWSGKTVSAPSTFAIGSRADGSPCAPLGFAPGMVAGATSPVAGSSSAFVLRLTRGDSDQNLAAVNVTLPPGLLAKLAGAPLCSDADALAGSCPAASQLGSATVAVGAGSNPLFIPQPGKAPTAVYLAGPYRGGPYSLVIRVPAQAGPFDLGVVTVRAAIYVDPVTAQVTVRSDPLPQIIQGIPLPYRDVRVTVDKPGFMQAPTSCAPMQVSSAIAGVGAAPQISVGGDGVGVAAPGPAVTVTSPFQVGGCARLGFRPRLAMALSGRGRTRSGAHPVLTATLTQGGGQANIRSARVTLPLSLALDPGNSRHVCSYDVAQAVHGGAVGCPASTVVGTASAVTPLLSQPLSGPVYLVQGIRFGPGGHRIHTLPTLLVALRGQIALDLRASSSVDGAGRLVTTFPAVPDAAVSRFTLQINGGPKGLLVITGRGRSICTAAQVASVGFGAQSGRTTAISVAMSKPCPRASHPHRRPRKRGKGRKR